MSYSVDSVYIQEWGGGGREIISIRKILEIEKKLQTWWFEINEKSKSKGNVLVNEFIDLEIDVIEAVTLNEPFLSVFVTDNDIDNRHNDLTVLTFLAGAIFQLLTSSKASHLIF